MTTAVSILHTNEAFPWMRGAYRYAGPSSSSIANAATYGRLR